jgi:putative ABC transport system permease protein
MNLFTIALKSIRQRLLASSLTLLSVALGIMLMVSVLVFHGIFERIFQQQSIGYDLIVGPKGSDLQLVLSSVYRISPPIQNVPYLYYEELKHGKEFKNYVDVAVPICLGDYTNEGNFPIVGTTKEYFTTPYAPSEPGQPDKKFLIRFKPGYENMKGSLDAIIGSEVAKRNGWDIGSKFRLIHAGIATHQHKEQFEVIGVMQRTGTPNDKTAFVPLEGFFSIAEHAKPEVEMRARLQDFFETKYSDAEWDVVRRKKYALREVTSVFIKAKRPKDDPNGTDTMAAARLQSIINQGYKALAVNPIVPMKRLMDNVVGNVRKAVLVLIGLIIVVSGVSIFVSIYNSMADRRKEIAIMRALGARRQTVFSIILAESVLLCVGGGALGILLGHGLVFAAAPYVEAKTGLLISPFAFESTELWLLPLMVVFASLVGFVPGMTAYRTDVADALGD